MSLATQLLAHGPARDGWADEAECKRRGMHPDEFHPRPDDRNISPRVAAACAACPVKLDCLAETLRYNSRHDGGIRGGIGTKARDKLRREVRLLREQQAQ